MSTAARRPARLGFRTRLLVASFALLAVFGLASGWWLHQELGPLLEHRDASAQMRSARVIRAQLRSQPLPPDPGLIDPVVDAVGTALDSRVVVFHSDGRRLGDSTLPVQALADVTGEPVLPEVAAVLSPEGPDGAVGRRPAGLDEPEHVFTAVPLDADGWRGAILVARPTADVDTAIAGLLRVLVLAGFVGLLASLGMSGLASWLMARDLRRLLEDTAALATGREAPHAPPVMEEYASIAGSVRVIKQDLDRTVSTLATERNRFEAVLAGMSEAVIALDAGGCLTLVNPAASGLLGIGRARYGETLLETVRVPDLDAVAERALGGEPGSAEFELRRRQSEGTVPRQLIANATPLASGGCVITLLDVTDVRRLETIRRDFVANVSHELRTPVSIISASAEALVDGAIDDPEYASHFLQAIERNAVRLGALIEDLLCIARLEEGRQSMELYPVPLADLITGVTEVLGPRLNDRRHRVVIDIPTDCLVLADAGALEQVLVNLLENARKYTPEKGTIQLRTAPSSDDPDSVRIEVADDGPGIAAHHRPRLFERFYRVDPGRARDVGGTGLGLAIVKHLAESMNGEVGMSPNTPQGSVFWVRLPRAPVGGSSASPEAEAG